MATLSAALPNMGQMPAIIVPGKPDALSISYQQLESHVSSFQRQLAHLGIAPQSAVSLALPNCYEFIVAFLAASWQRAIAAPLNPAYKQEEFEFYINDLSSAIVLIPRGSFRPSEPIVCASQRYEAAIAECYWDGHEVVLEVKDWGKLLGRDGVEVQTAQPDDIALILHTSGTTGRPKAVPLTHRNLIRTMRNIQTTYRLTFKDRTLLVMPLFHVHGLVAGFLTPLFSSGSVIVPSRFSASEFWGNFITYKANWYTAVPTIHQILLRSPLPSKLPDIRFIRSCSSPLPPKTFNELEHAFNAPVLEAYAMTEGAHQITSNPLPPARRYPGSVGVSQGVELKILNVTGSEVPYGREAEICIRGENVTKGYLDNPEANKTSFTKDGFFRTGDQGFQDRDGYVTITGRIKELINKGGEKISPVEVDNVGSQHPFVAEAVCFAIADEMYGQDVGMAVVFKEGKKTTPDELCRWIGARVARFKVPKQIFITDQMPQTATGKVQRRMVAEAMLKQQQPKAKL